MIDVVGMYHMIVLYDKSQNGTKYACKFLLCVYINTFTCLMYKLDGTTVQVLWLRKCDER